MRVIYLVIIYTLLLLVGYTPALEAVTPTRDKYQNTLAKPLKTTLFQRIIEKKIRKKVQKNTPSISEESTDGFAIAGFVLGLLSVLSVLGIGVVGAFVLLLPPLAIVLSAIGLARTKRYKGKGKGRKLAAWGLALGILVSLFWLIIMIAFAIGW